jgi:hypothetical protein
MRNSTKVREYFLDWKKPLTKCFDAIYIYIDGYDESIKLILKIMDKMNG